MSERIGRYEIQAEIGRGGFGRVYKAFDPMVGRVVAIKVLLPETNDPEFLTRFKMEATTAGNLHHPNLVTIHEFGEDNGSQFLVMEYLDGEDLQSIIRSRKPLTIHEKVEVMQQVAAGLYCAHENNVIHRDIKPSNVMVLRDNLVKLMDFGIARLTRSDTTRFTKAGFLVGTLNYMSPEQFRDAEVDALCDIWAFGVIYYEFLTGRFPFEGTSTPAILYSITSVEPPAPATLIPECPEALSQMIMKTLAKDRDLRYQSLQEFQLDVGPLLLDMRRQRSNELLPEARTLFEQERGEEAQRLVRRILDLDPMNVEARQLRERIQKMAQQQAIVPKIVALKKSGQEQLSHKRYAEAIQSFENALRLDSSNTEIRVLLEDARNAVGQYKRAQELAEAAAALVEKREFEAAHEIVRQAFEVDPANQRAREVMARVQHAFDSQERRREVEQIVRKAKGFIQHGQFDEALGVLVDARTRLHEPLEVLEAIEEAETGKRKRAERDRLERALRDAGELLRQERVEEAENLLHPLRKAAPDDPAIAQALQRCAEVRRVLERREAVRRVTERTKTLQQDGELERAVALVQRALQEFQNDPNLTGLLRDSELLLRQRDERRAIDETLREARDLRTAGDMAGASKLLAEAQRKYGDVPALLSLAKEIGKDLRAKEDREAAQIVANEVRILAARSEWTAASAKLRDALQRFPAEPELTALSESVERGLKEEAAGKEREAAIDTARGMYQRGKMDDAAAEVRTIRGKYGDWPALAQLGREIESAREFRERRRAVEKTANEARERIAASQWDAARNVLQQGLAQYPSEPELTALLDSIERGLNEQQSRKKRDEILRGARALESQGKDADALAALDEGLKQFGGDPELFSARAALAMRSAERQRAGDISARVDRISQAIDSGQFDAARREIDDATRHFGDQGQLRRLSEELDVKQRMAELDATARTIEQLVARGALAEAKQRMQEALAGHPRDARLLRLQQTLESEGVFLEALQRVEQHLGTHRLDLAENALRSAAGMKPGDEKIAKLTQRIAKERERLAGERAKTLKKAQELTARAAFEEAGTLLRGLQDAHPEDAEVMRALDEMNSARGAHIKRQTYASRINDLENKRKADKPQLVKEAAAVLLAEFPGDPQARSLLDWAEQRLQEIGASSIHVPVVEPGISTGVKAGLALGLLLAAGGGSLLLLKQHDGKSAWNASPEKIPFQWRIGEGLPDPKQIGLSSSGGAVTLKASSSAPWLTVDPAETTPPNGFAIAIAPKDLPPGEYKAAVNIESASSQPKARKVDVTLRILPRTVQNPSSPGNSISSDVDLLTFEVRQGATMSDSKLIRVRGTGITRFNVTTRTPKGNWLHVTPSAAAIPSVVSVTVSADGLAPGPYQGEVILTGDKATDVLQRVPVSLRVREERVISSVKPNIDPVKPPVTEPVKPPVTDPVKPPVTDPVKPTDPGVTPSGTYAGIRRGVITWVGELAPGQKITITKDGLAAGGGSTTGRNIPGDVAINVDVRTQGIRLESAPSREDRYSRMVLVNQSTTSISLIQIAWTVRD
ncbi:MAG: protein kinase [Acidobacteria bacterium]|nr:protein kinase [Acidobacteriota bacterium]